MKNYVDKDKLQEYTTKLTAKNKTIFATKAEVGSPLVASTIAEMTDESKIYVYVGSETGYTSGNWYYYDGSAWVSGGIYNSEGFVLDDTLTDASKPAQAKAVGDAVDLLNNNLRERTNNLLNMTSTAGWYPPRVDEDITVSAPAKNTLRITSNVAQQYATARLDFDVTGIDYIYTMYSGFTVSGDGAGRIRLYRGENYETVTQSRKTWDVREYNTVSLEIAATTGTAATGSVDYKNILVTADATLTEYVPYYIYEPYAHKVEQDFKDFQIEQITPNWLLYSSSADYNNRCKNYPIYVPAGSVVHFDAGANGFRGGYHLYSTYTLAKSAYDSESAIQGDIYNYIYTASRDITVSQDSWFMLIGYFADASEVTLANIPSGNSVTRPLVAEFDEIKLLMNTKTDTDNSIIANNDEAIYNLANAKMRSTRVDREVTNKPSVLSLLHFSDLHGDTANLKRIVEFRTAFPNFIDDAICTGDMIYSHYNANAMNFWDGVQGAENIMMTIGNHDVWKEDATEFAPGSYITQAEAYAAYISPYAENWGITYTENHTYYYKDYTNEKIRLICLDMMLADTDRATQLTWLQGILSSAIDAGLSVVIAQHFASRPNTVFPCNFSALDGYASTTEGWSPEAAYMNAVETFKTNGGDFICWLGGHTHCDYICYDSNYPNQLFITITCAKNSETFSDQARIANTKSQDAFNIIAFDSYSKLIKLIRVGANSDSYQRGRNTLTINYSTKTIVTNS